MKVLEKNIDPEGRVLLPKGWRERHGKEVIVIETEDFIKIMPKKRKKLTEFFDTVKADIKSPLADWHSVKRELYSKRWQK